MWTLAVSACLMLRTSSLGIKTRWSRETIDMNWLSFIVGFTVCLLLFLLFPSFFWSSHRKSSSASQMYYAYFFFFGLLKIAYLLVYILPIKLLLRLQDSTQVFAPALDFLSVESSVAFLRLWCTMASLTLSTLYHDYLFSSGH